LPNRIKVVLIASLTIVSSLMAAAPVGAVTQQKVVIIVGPTGAQTADYRSKGDAIYAAAVAAGATAVKVYSPNATWANVKAAVNGANIVVYLGHGNGYPNPYGSIEYTDRTNGWGLNRTTTNGDSDNWSTTMVYCGEKVLRGLLTSSDDAARLTYCGGTANDGITPAANWVMIYNSACYAPGASEGWDTPATESVAMQRVRNYSYPGLSVGGGAYFSTDMHEGGPQLVDTILRNPTMAFGAIAERANGYDASRQRRFNHPDLAGRRIWIQNTGTPTSGDYFFAYAGVPGLTPSGTNVAYTEPPVPDVTPPSLLSRSPAASAMNVGLTPTVTARLSESVTGVGTGTMVLSKTSDYIALSATVSYDPTTFTATLQPTAPLSPDTTYRLGMSGSIKDMSGNSLPWTTWTFRTATYDPPALLAFRAGTHTAYQFTATGTMTALKTYTLTSNSGASTTTRTTLVNQSGTWFYVSSGIWAGYWIRQSNVVWLASSPAPPAGPSNATFNPAVSLTFKMGTHTGYQFNATGGMTAQKTCSLTRDSGAPTSARSTITNQSGTWFYVTAGIWGGYWVRLSDVVFLTP
jgi:hypothetical protein